MFLGLSSLGQSIIQSLFSQIEAFSPLLPRWENEIIRLIKTSSLQNSQDSWHKTHKYLPWGHRGSKQDKNLLWCSCLQVTEETLETQLPRVTAHIGVGFSVTQLPPPQKNHPWSHQSSSTLVLEKKLNKTHWFTKLDMNRILLLLVVLISVCY